MVGPTGGRNRLCGEAFEAGAARAPAALSGLDAIVSDRAQPAIVRATALDLARAGAAGGRLAIRAKNDADALVRAGGGGGAGRGSGAASVPRAAPLLSDPVKLVRIERRARAGGRSVGADPGRRSVPRSTSAWTKLARVGTVAVRHAGDADESRGGSRGGGATPATAEAGTAA